MSTQTPTTPKGPRNARRNRKNSTANSSHPNHHRNAQANNLTPPPHSRSSPPSPSPEGAARETTNNVSEEKSKKKKGRQGKKNGDTPKPSPMTNGHRHASSQPSVYSPALKEGTHYAGPTFHASPAPSALPIPSFFSKSVPENEPVKPVGGADQSNEADPLATTPTKPKGSTLHSQDVEEHPSPLDFLFKSARGTRVTNRGSESEPRPRRASPFQSNATTRQLSETPGAVFPLELEAPDSNKLQIGPSFAASYQERMSAFRSASSPSRSSDNLPLDEGQRKAKSEALKDLLLNPRLQRPASASPRLREEPNVFNSRSAAPGNVVPHPARHASGPSSPVPFDDLKGSPKGRSPGGGSIAHQYLASVCNGTQPFRNPSSNLRQELSPTSPTLNPQHSRQQTNASTQTPLKRSQTFIGDVASPTPSRAVPAFAPQSPAPPLRSFSTSTNALDTKRMEDDLRRILKIDSNSRS
ncbi:hypothetical protein FQN53_005706 [Emmonsiellopsis sp. PD_33]|nr:hypothetical protein FQN53_005706 [Emmonsiellopsis sp. PD_33]